VLIVQHVPLRVPLSLLDQLLVYPYAHPPPSPLPYRRVKQHVRRLPLHAPHVASSNLTLVGVYMMLDAQ
jgi:hypothetical protein